MIHSDVQLIWILAGLALVIGGIILLNRNKLKKKAKKQSNKKAQNIRRKGKRKQ